MLWDVPVNFHKKVNLTALVAYAQTNNDRRQDLLEAYIARHRRDGLIVYSVIGHFSSIEIAYHRRPHYGRLVSRRPSDEKLTLEARFFAFGSHCAELDAPSCHPRLLSDSCVVQRCVLWTQNPAGIICLPTSTSSLRSCPPWRIYLGFVFIFCIWIPTKPNYDLRGSGPSKRPASRASITKKPVEQSQESMVLSSPL